MAIHQMVLGYVAAHDHWLMRRVHRWMPPQWLRLWMLWATRLGDGWLWCAAGLMVVVAGGNERFAAIETAGSAAAFAILLFEVLKRLTNRRRPCALEPHCWADLLPPDRFSFPSGHSMTAFAVSVSLALFYPAWLPALLLCAVSIAASRILLGMHFLSDVIFGSVLGTLVAYASYAAWS